jgi:hypothetical protein
MSVEITAADPDEAWDELVEASPAGTPFHRRAALDVLADHANATLHPLVGYRDGEPVGAFPVFEKSKGPVSAIFSPPPDLKVSYLGPVLRDLDADQGNPARAERRRRQFVERCIDHLDDHVSPSYVHVRADYDYADPRPFDWNGFGVTPRYTYVVDLDRDRDDLFAAFSSDARRNVRTAEDADVEVAEGGRETLDRVIEQVAARHREQGRSYLVTPEFVGDLHDRLADGVVRPYAVTVDGDFAGGMVTLESDDTIYRWQGGAKPDVDLPVNDALDWHIMTDAIDRRLTAYDLVGANNRRLCSYKAKFTPELRTYYSFRRGTVGMNVASGVYSFLRK